MADYPVRIFDAANITNPQDPGNLPFEDNTYLSSLSNGQTITWVGSGESTELSITDNANTTFDEAQNNQRLTDPVTFGGVSYNAGQIVTPTYTIFFSGSDGNSYTMTSFNFSPNTNNEIPDAVFWEGAIPPVGTVLTVTGEVNPTAGGSRNYSDMVICFGADTRIDTPAGKIAVGALQAGDMVTTFAGRTRAVRWTGSRLIQQAELDANPKLRPVVITKGALGGGMPDNDLTVSRQHRILVTSTIAQRMFGQTSVLVAAHVLTGLPGIYIDTDTPSVTYHHVLLDDHDILCANGVAAESLFLGDQTRSALSQEQLDEIRMIFPQLFLADAQIIPAFPFANGRRQKQLINRHISNRKPLLNSADHAT